MLNPNGALLFTTREPDSLNRIAGWLDSGKIPKVEEHDFFKWVVGSLEDVDYSTPKIVVVDLDWKALPGYLPEELNRLISNENVVVFCKNMPDPDDFDERAYSDCSRALRDMMPRRFRLGQLRADLQIPLRQVPGFAKAVER